MTFTDAPQLVSVDSLLRVFRQDQFATKNVHITHAPHLCPTLGLFWVARRGSTISYVPSDEVFVFILGL